MSKLQVFDPPMCCSTGVCGPQVDPALIRFASDLEWLKANGVEVERFNLAQAPAAFLGNRLVADAIRGRDGGLPLLLLDGEIVAQGGYPTREALAGLAGLSGRPLATKIDAPATAGACCAPAEAAPVALSRPRSSPKKGC